MKRQSRLKKKRIRLPKSFHRVRRRVSVTWEPEWEPVFKAFALNQIKTHRWMCEHIYDTEDLIQDAYLVFLKVKDTYPRVVDAPHFMSLFKTSLRNHFMDKGRQLKAQEEAINQGNEELYYLYGVANGTLYTEELSYLAAHLSSAPSEVKMVLGVFQDEEKLSELRTPYRQGKLQQRENLNQKLCRVLGIDRCDLVGLVKSWIKEEGSYV